jgi:hypothetical protein
MFWRSTRNEACPTSTTVIAAQPVSTNRGRAPIPATPPAAFRRDSPVFALTHCSRTHRSLCLWYAPASVGVFWLSRRCSAPAPGLLVQSPSHIVAAVASFGAIRVQLGDAPQPLATNESCTTSSPQRRHRPAGARPAAPGRRNPLGLRTRTNRSVRR